MLQYLNIQNLALLDEVTLDFQQGFIAVTGETGAGKSVLLGALNLLSGARSDKSLIRKGTDKCEVQAGFYFENSSAVDSVLKELELPVTEEGSLLITRVLPRKGMAKIHVNGRVTTLTNLQKLGEFWIDYHGPGEPQKLFQNKFQLEMLDLFGGNEKDCADYSVVFQEREALRKEAQELRDQAPVGEDEKAFLKSQLDEIDEVNITEESIDELERQYNLIDRGRDYSKAIQSLRKVLSSNSGIIDLLGEALGEARDLAEIDPNLESISGRVESTLIDLEDLNGEVASLEHDYAFDPMEASQVQSRMEKWMRLRRKHGGNVGTVLAAREKLANRLESSSGVEDKLEKLANEIELLEVKLKKKAQKITQVRRKAAVRLGADSKKIMQSLGLKKAELKIEINTEKELTAGGDSSSEFLFCPNPGQDLLPLRKVASSGETARVMLAIKTVLAKVDSTPVLVFDEVDANVGGEVGKSVGAEMANLAQEHQVVCVTHLPQVASQASQHYLVEKKQEDTETGVSIGPIHQDEDVRVGELARMLGDRTSDTALVLAKELIAC